jgi:hypothetical protein
VQNAPVDRALDRYLLRSPAEATGFAAERVCALSCVRAQCCSLIQVRKKGEWLVMIGSDEDAIAAAVRAHAWSWRRGIGSSGGCDDEISADRKMPHGGMKASGYGKDMSAYSFEEYTQVKHVMSDLTGRAAKPWHTTIIGDL